MQWNILDVQRKTQQPWILYPVKFFFTGEKESFSQINKNGGNSSPADLPWKKNDKIISTGRKNMIKVKLNLHKERESVREGINESNMKSFYFFSFLSDIKDHFWKQQQ